VRVLVDTNAWIALFEDSPVLTEEAAQVMESGETECFVSIASIWEAAIKVGTGKLRLPYDLEKDLPRILDENGFELLGLEVADVAGVNGLERIHGDPFDRIQVIQARRRKLQVVSRDAVFDHFGLKRIW
jgi:PIN domain nuclease of toxin-antitoxin system